MFLTNIFTKTAKKVDVGIIDLKSEFRAIARKFLLELTHNYKLEKEVQIKPSLKLKDRIEKNKMQDNALASEYMVAFAKNFYFGEQKSKRKDINHKIIKQITSSDSMNNQAKGIINELYKEQISKNKKLIMEEVSN